MKKGGELQVCGERHLQFFPGMARGPAYGVNQYDYTSCRGSKAARVSCSQGEFFAYFNGGCFFVEAHSHPACTVVSSYLDLPGGPAAIITGRRGRGAFCLSGVHLETRACDLNLEDPYLPPIALQLQKTDAQRRLFFASLLSFLGMMPNVIQESVYNRSLNHVPHKKNNDNRDEIL